MANNSAADIAALTAQEKIIETQLKEAEQAELKKREQEILAELGQAPESEPDSEPDSEERRLEFAKQLEIQGAPELPEQAPEGPTGLLEKGFDILARPAAATRSGIAAAVEGGPIAGAKAFGEALTQPSEVAPTDEELAAILGFPTKEIPAFAIPAQPGGIGLDIEREAATPRQYRPSELAAVPIGIAADVSQYVPLKPVIAGAGAIAQAPLKLAGKAIGATGYLFGKTITQGAQDVAELAGSAISPRFGEKAKEAIAQTVEAAKTQGPEVVRGVVSAYRDALNPSLQPGFEKAVEVAVRNNIDPALLPFSVKFGPNSFVEQLRRYKAQQRITNELKQHNEGLRQVQNAVSADLSRIAGNKPVPNPEQAGAAILDGYKNSVSDLFDSYKLRYSTVIDNLNSDYLRPDLKDQFLRKLDNQIKTVDTQLKTALSETKPTLESTKSDLVSIRKYLAGEKAQKIEEPGIFQRFINRIKEFIGLSPGQMAMIEPDPAGLSGYIAQMQELGKLAYSNPKFQLGSNFSDRRVLKNVYQDMRSTLLDIVESQGGKEARSLLEQANDAQSQFLKQNDLIESVLNNPKAAPEKIFETLIEKGDSKQLSALAEILGKDSSALKMAKSAYLDQLIQRNTDGDILFSSTQRKIKNSDQFFQIKNKLFSENEALDFDDLIELGSAFGNPILNPSGTAITQQIKEAFLHPVLTTSTLITSESLIRNAERQAAIKLANQKKGKLTPEVMSEIARMITSGGNSQSTAQDIVQAIKDSTDKTGIGFSMSPTPTEIVGKSLLVAGRIYAQNPTFGPIYIPPEFREETIRQIMADDSLTPLEKARNKFSLETNGYLLKVGAGPRLLPKAKMIQSISKDAIRAE